MDLFIVREGGQSKDSEIAKASIRFCTARTTISAGKC
jgi:hypothetical protein